MGSLIIEDNSGFTNDRKQSKYVKKKPKCEMMKTWKNDT